MPAWAVAALTTLALPLAAFGQERLIEKVGSVFDDVAHGFNIVGQKAQSLLGPGLGFGKDDTGGVTQSRTFEENYPVGPQATIFVSNEFGEIHVGAWDNQVAQVTAQINVRAETAELAGEIARGINIHADFAGNRLEVSTILPDTRQLSGKPAIEVHYTIAVPRDANVIARNDFGDTYVKGIGGTVALDVRYGAVGLMDIAGAVNVRSRGEFGLQAENLRQGGTFELDGAEAQFANISGNLKISNFRGSVDLRRLGPDAGVDVVSESGPIYLHLNDGETPDLSATALFGEFESEIPLSQTTQSGVSIARSPNLESRQHVSLRATFANIIIQRNGSDAPPLPSETVLTQAFKEAVTGQAKVPADRPALSVSAIPGNVRVIGTDEDEMRITMTKYVRVVSQDNARAALQGIDAKIEETPEGVKITTAVIDDMAALGCKSQRVDIVIECPRTVAVDIRAADGHSHVSGIGSNVVVRQGVGMVTVEHVKAAVEASNDKGGIRVANCAGTVTATATYGDITLSEIYGKMTTVCTGGNTIIESPRAAIDARNTGGDVRVFSFDAVAGDYQVTTEQGSINILLPPGTDAAISVRAENGSIRSAIPLTGSIDKDVQEFVRVSDAPQKVILQTKNGSVSID